MKKIKLGELIDVTRGMSLPGDKYAESGDLIRLTLGNFNIQGNGFKPNTSKTDLYYTGSVKKEFIMKKGDIITPLTEQTYGLLGSTARIPESGKYIQSQDVALIRSKSDKLYEDFCYYLISSPSVRKQLGAAAQQTKIRHTSPDKIKDCEVIIPEDVNQQIKITNLLNTIENKIALNNKTNTELENMAKTIYDYWFTQFAFPDKNGHPYKTSGGQMVYNETLKREIPAGWEVGKLCDIAKFSTETTNTEKLQNYITTDNILPNKQGITKAEYIPTYGNVLRYEEYDILIANIRPYFKKIWLSNTNGMCSNDVLCIKAKNSAYKYFLYRLLWRDDFFDYVLKGAKGSKMPRGDKNHIMAMPIVFPNNEDIIESFDTFFTPLQNQIWKNQKENEELTKLRDYLLPLLMNGQIEVK